MDPAILPARPSTAYDAFLLLYQIHSSTIDRGPRGLKADRQDSTVTQSTDSKRDDLAAAAEKGRQAGELFDLKLRQLEAEEREAKRTSRDTALRLPRIEELSYDGLSRESLIRDLRDQIERLATFERVVLSSRAWRLIQRARRMMGRR